MKAAVVHGIKDVRYEEIETPKAEPGKVLIKVKYTGICGSDVPRVNAGACHYYPNVLGHEFSGVVEEVGEGVISVKKGDRVAGVPLVPCMKCADCQKGNYSLCKHYSFIGSREFGSFAQYVSVPEKNAVKFDDAISFEQAAFFEPATVALHGLKRVSYQGGKQVAILGGGTIGMFTMQWAKIYGAKSVTVFDINPARLELAKRLGADYVIDTREENFMEQAMALTGVCFIGTPTKELSFSVKEWENMNRKEFTLTGSWMSYSAPFPGEEWELTAHYFKTGELKFDESFIYKKFPLSQSAKAFHLFEIPGEVKGKILIDSEQ